MSDTSGDQAWTTGDHGEVEEPPHPPPALDLRVARVLEAAPHPDADRLLVLSVDVAEPTPRALVAGLAGRYEPAELTGKHIVIVANLQPARLRGELSQGMLLAAEQDGVLGLLLAPDAAPGDPLTYPGAPEPADQVTIDDFRRHELVADDRGVTLDGTRIEAPRLAVDRGVKGPLR